MHRKLKKMLVAAATTTALLGGGVLGGPVMTATAQANETNSREVITAPATNMRHEICGIIVDQHGHVVAIIICH